MRPADRLALHIANPVERPSTALPMEIYRPKMLAYERWLHQREDLEISARLDGFAAPVPLTRHDNLATIDAPPPKKAKSYACKDCGAETQCAKQYRCVPCQDRAADEQRRRKTEYRARRRKEAQAKGNCRRHPERKALPNRTVCETCLEASRARYERRYSTRITRREDAA